MKARFKIRVIGIITIILIYIPLLQGYITGCVETSSGTFLTHNLYSLAYNYVTMQGDSAATIVRLIGLCEAKGRERYQQKRNDYCTNMMASTFQTYQDFIQTVKELNTTLDHLNTTLFLTNHCVNSTHLQYHRSDYESLLSQYHSILYSPPVLHNSSFNCDSLSLCEITCSPPNNPILLE